MSEIDGVPSKEVRFKEFLRRLENARPARTFDEAYRLLGKVLNGVEDELTQIPYDPENWHVDGRLYPPFADRIRAVEGREDVKRFRSRGHNTFIGANGAIEIQQASGREVVLRKDGADGRGVWDP